MKRMLLLSFVMILSVSMTNFGCAKKGKGRSRHGVPSESGAQIQDVSVPMEDLELAALRGEDIPLMEQPDLGSFVEPGQPDIFQDVRFDYNKSDIRPNERQILNRIAGWAKENPRYQIMIQGHCDERGSNEYNLALGEQRALSVRRFLISLGVEPGRLHTISYGEERPLDSDHSEAAWSTNRRSHFMISE
ncbi:MAG: peptidoglycan-associated lipoprotein Pal [Chlamydiota bacterium]|nr:peptidoglycan-associated lipoprotein Pal [Chlamydiota bacterium]